MFCQPGIKRWQNAFVVLGGRAFISTKDYSEFLARYKDFEELQNGECLQNIKFMDAREVRRPRSLSLSTARLSFSQFDASTLTAHA